jgi:hypothetical protein
LFPRKLTFFLMVTTKKGHKFLPPLKFPSGKHYVPPKRQQKLTHRHSLTSQKNCIHHAQFTTSRNTPLNKVQHMNVGRDSSIGIVTRYWLESPGIESRWRTVFSAPVQTDRGPHSASYTMDVGSFDMDMSYTRIMHPKVAHSLALAVTNDVTRFTSHGRCYARA